MKKIALIAVLMLPVAACTQTQQGAAIGGASGAAIGAAVANDDVEGAVIGGAAGAIAGALIGRAAEGRDQCVYRDEYGRRYVDDCPAGY
ncbi:YMGG-like glycine zipper-containing protein [Aquibium sp. A9E412]|uniref:YMGG-like glycine zipper-containing protein n=1 Tax=Aquibium sp. A9E412 TaxID=2976767 RepID=UPI0025AFF8B2|nr:YMGG-like glycine zipper-containing protein [Aquibium sp. A9E412]MDN2566726.1 YMGG-like glycine zipper-containing protein [Aquibium sp. A9E412]